MPIIEPEYPEGCGSMEMELVRMLCEKRCWNDYRDISMALWTIRHHAENMRMEQILLRKKSNIDEENKE